MDHKTSGLCRKTGKKYFGGEDLKLTDMTEICLGPFVGFQAINTAEALRHRSSRKKPFCDYSIEACDQRRSMQPVNSLSLMEIVPRQVDVLQMLRAAFGKSADILEQVAGEA